MASQSTRKVRAKWLRFGAALAVVGLSVGTAAMLEHAGPKPPTATLTASSTASATHHAVDASDWMALTGFERSTLEPLHEHWTTLDASSRARWINVADRLKGRPEVIVARAQRRMEAWQRLTPEQRAAARVGYALGSRLSAKERHTRWLTYQARVRSAPSPAQDAAGSAAAPTGQPVQPTPVALPIANGRNTTPFEAPATERAPNAATGRNAS